MTILDEILARSKFAPVTRAKYARVIAKWIEFAGESPSNWTRPTCQAFYDAMLARGVSRKSANVYIASLRYVSRWYATQAGRPELDFAIVQTQAMLPDDEDNSRHALTQEGVIALLQTCDPSTPYGIRDRTLLVVGLETGMRRMSLEAIKLEAFTHRTGYPAVKVPIKGASGLATFEVPLSDTAMVAIEDLRSRIVKRKAGPLFTTFDRKIDGRGRLTYTPTNEAISSAAIYKIITVRARAAGLQVHPHLLRHTFVTWRQIAGLNAIQIASITGHKTFGDEWRNIKPYVDLEAVAQTARESTPAWLATYVASMVS